MGESTTIEIGSAVAGERLDRILSLETGLSRSAVAALIDAGDVRVDGHVTTRRSVRVEVGQVLSVIVTVAEGSVGPVADPTLDFTVLHEDDHMLVVDKPADTVVHAGAGHHQRVLVNGLLARYPEIATVGEPDRPGIVHRLDWGTSGALMVARTNEAYRGLVALLSRHRVDRHYWALVRDIPEAGTGTIDAPIGRSQRRRTDMAIVADGRDAITHYSVIETFTSPVPCARLECRLETGRTHQIRVHLASIGHPVLGDGRYGRAHGPFEGFGRLALHAESVGLTHPVTGERLDIEAPLPPELLALTASLDQE